MRSDIASRNNIQQARRRLIPQMTISQIVKEHSSPKGNVNEEVRWEVPLTRQRMIRVHKKWNSFVEAVELKATNRKVAQKRPWSFTTTVPWTMIKAQRGQKYLKNLQGSLKYCQMADLGYRVVSTWKNSHSLQARGRASLKVSTVETWWRFYDYCDKYLSYVHT
jgi:hypothetical protein